MTDVFFTLRKTSPNLLLYDFFLQKVVTVYNRENKVLRVYSRNKALRGIDHYAPIVYIISSKMKCKRTMRNACSPAGMFEMTATCKKYVLFIRTVIIEVL